MRYRSMIMPGVVRSTLGVVAVSLRQYIEWLTALKRSASMTIGILD
jgi:hypothetical protein